jgi:hypothetical protein
MASELHTTGAIEWVTICKRTEQPKLGWLAREFRARGILVQFGPGSHHASATLQVPRDSEDRAWNFLGSQWKHTRYTVDDIRDDHPAFTDRG